MIYRIVENFDPNAVPGANHVQTCFDFSIAYNMQKGIGNTETLTIAYIDTSGKWVVRADEALMTLLPTPQYTVKSAVDADRSAWESWQYQTEAGTRGRGRNVTLGDIPPGIWTAFNASGGRLPIAQLPFFDLSEDVTNMKPCASASCGPFRSSEIADNWYGDTTIQPLD